MKEGSGRVRVGEMMMEGNRAGKMQWLETQAKEWRQPLESGKGKETSSSLASPEGT